MMRSFRFRSAAALASFAASLLVLNNCHDGLLYAPATGLTASADLRASFDASLGNNGAAFDKVDEAFVQILAGTDVRAEQTTPFAPSAGVATLRLEVPLRQTSEGVTANVELRWTGKALFRGSATPTLSVGTRTPVNLSLTPVAASLSCGPPVQITSYGPAGRLLGAALFATGDTILNAAVTWSTTSGDAATVSAAGDVTAVKDGDVQVACASSGMTGTRTLHVLAAVAKIELAPPVDTLPVGGSVTLTPTLRDANGNVITSRRTVTWQSSGPAATVNTSGVVTAVSIGAVQITATSGSTTGTAQIVVSNPPPSVTTNAASNVAGTSATLNGTVLPNGPNVTAWFEWSTDATFASLQSTDPQSITNGSTGVSFSAPLTGLALGTTYYYRAVAASGSGAQVRGATVSFTTVRPPAVTTNSPVITTSTFSLSSTVTPNSSATTAWFQYTATSPFGGPAILTVTPNQNIGAGSSPVAVSAAIVPLPFYSYVVTAMASNAGGTTAGSTVRFQAGGPPVLGQTSAALGFACNFTCTLMSTSVNPEGFPTAAWFEWSTDSTFKTFSATTRQPIGAGTTSVAFSDSVQFTTTQSVFVRAAAINAVQTVRGPAVLAQSPIFNRRP